MSKQGLTEGLLSGVAIALDPNTAQGAAAIASIINMKYGREDELESDDLGVLFMINAGYNPEEMIGVMQITPITPTRYRITDRCLSKSPEVLPNLTT